MLNDPNWDRKAVEEIPLLDTPSLKALIYILRRKEMWPHHFAWDYADCYRCAMGLAFSLWEDNSLWPSVFSMSAYARRFDISASQVREAFYGGIKDNDIKTSWAPKGKDGKPDLTLVTPEMIADMLESYIK